MPVGGHKVQVSILVEVSQGHAPASCWQSINGQTRFLAPVLEDDRTTGNTFLLPERGMLTEEMGDDHILKLIAVVISISNAHISLHLPLSIHSNSPGGSYILKRAIMPVSPQGIRLRVVGNQDIGPAIAIKISGQAAHAPPSGSQSCPLRHISKSSVTIVSIKHIWQAIELTRHPVARRHPS